MTYSATATQTAPAAKVVNSLPARVLRWARERPERLALRHRELGLWREYSWREYAECCAQTGLGLRALGVGAGDRVAIIGDNRPEWCFADLGIQGIGAVVVGVYATSPAEEVHYVLEHSGSVVAIVEDEEQLDKVLAVRDRLPMLREVVLIEPRGAAHFLADGRAMTFASLLARGAKAAFADFEESVAALDPNSTAVLIYTSGTTGAPKGAMLSHANLDFTARTVTTAFDLTPDDETLSYLPLCHIAEQIFSLLAPLEMGSVVSFGGGVDELVADLREIQPTIFFGVPRVWEKMLAGIEIKMNDASWLKRRNFHFWMGVGRTLAKKRIERVPLTPLDRALEWLGWLLLYRPLRERLGMARVRYAGSGAAPVSPLVIKAFWSLGVRIREAYGQTEGSGLATYTPEHDVRPGAVGVTYPNVELRIAEDGEILVRGGCVFTGYYRNDDATRETVDADGWLHTGDVGELSDDGFLRITDRKKDLIITAGGKNIAPSWIENKLKVSPFVREAVVIGDRRKYCSALIGIEFDTVADWATRRRISYTTYEDLSAQPEVRELIETWIEEVNADLAPVEQIKRFSMIPKALDHEEGELTATQKVKRRAIEKIFTAEIEAMYK